MERRIGTSPALWEPGWNILPQQRRDIVALTRATGVNVRKWVEKHPELFPDEFEPDAPDGRITTRRQASHVIEWLRTLEFKRNLTNRVRKAGLEAVRRFNAAEREHPK